MDADEETATADHTGETAMNALDALRYDWDSAYEIENHGNAWRARRLDGLGGWIDADSPDDLSSQIIGDYVIKPVPRQAAEA